ncbi:unnamed protein product [Anisakis simplex]|uniref:TWiK family of potassium channels protein 7 n=1 Tax=Anisakis simplex TaxID=6269 RepID=A0A158PMR3_ANISI|nr:unnamed protein product [Anisakis simplex]
MDDQFKEIEGLLENAEPVESGSFKKYAKLVLPHVALVAVVCLYAVVGAWIFYSLESPHEDRLKRNGVIRINDLRKELVSSMWEKGRPGMMGNAGGGSGSISMEEWMTITDRRLQKFNENLYKAFKEEYVRYPDVRITKASSSDLQQQYQLQQHQQHEGADEIRRCGIIIFYRLMSLPGYGNIVPVTPYGRIACVVFALFGAPLAIITIGDLGKFLSECTIWLYKKMKKARNIVVYRFRKWWSRKNGVVSEIDEEMPSESENSALDWDDLIMDKTEVPVLLVFAILLLYIAFGGVLFAVLESWTYMDAFYYCFVSLTTIGFGDLVPERHEYIILMLIYLGVGLAVTTMCIDLVGIQYIQKIHYFGRKFRGTDLLHLLKRKRMIERRLAMGHGEEILQMYLQQLHDECSEPAMSQSHRCNHKEEIVDAVSDNLNSWQLDETIIDSAFPFSLCKIENLPTPTVLSVRRYDMHLVAVAAAILSFYVGKPFMYYRRQFRTSSWTDSGPSPEASIHCSLSTEPSVIEREVMYSNYRSPSPSLMSFEYEFPVPSPDYHQIAESARHSRRVRSCPLNVCSDAEHLTVTAADDAECELPSSTSSSRCVSPSATQQSYAEPASSSSPPPPLVSVTNSVRKWMMIKQFNRNTDNQQLNLLSHRHRDCHFSLRSAECFASGSDLSRRSLSALWALSDAAKLIPQAKQYCCHSSCMMSSNDNSNNNVHAYYGDARTYEYAMNMSMSYCNCRGNCKTDESSEVDDDHCDNDNVYERRRLTTLSSDSTGFRHPPRTASSSSSAATSSFKMSFPSSTSQKTTSICTAEKKINCHYSTILAVVNSNKSHKRAKHQDPLLMLDWLNISSRTSIMDLICEYLRTLFDFVHCNNLKMTDNLAGLSSDISTSISMNDIRSAHSSVILVSHQNPIGLACMEEWDSYIKMLDEYCKPYISIRSSGEVSAHLARAGAELQSAQIEMQAERSAVSCLSKSKSSMSPKQLSPTDLHEIVTIRMPDPMDSEVLVESTQQPTTAVDNDDEEAEAVMEDDEDETDVVSPICVESSSSECNSPAPPIYDIDLGAFELVDSGVSAEALLSHEEPVLYHQELPVHSVHHDTVQTEAALENLMSAPESMLSSIVPPTMVEDNYCFVVDGDKIRMGDIMGDDHWWKHTSRPTKYYYSEDLRKFVKVNCITAKGKVISAKLASPLSFTLQTQSTASSAPQTMSPLRSTAHHYPSTSVFHPHSSSHQSTASSTPRSSVSGTSSSRNSAGLARGEKVPLANVYKVVRFYSFWRTCTSFHRIVTMIDKVNSDYSSSPQTSSQPATGSVSSDQKRRSKRSPSSIPSQDAVSRSARTRPSSSSLARVRQSSTAAATSRQVPTFRKRLFVQYLWRNAKTIEKIRVQKEFDPRRQRLLRFVTDPNQQPSSQHASAVSTPSRTSLPSFPTNSQANANANPHTTTTSSGRSTPASTGTETGTGAAATPTRRRVFQKS